MRSSLRGARKTSLLKKLHVTSRARLDFKAVILHFQTEDVPNLGQTFADRFRHTCNLLRSFPYLGRKLPQTRGVQDRSSDILQIPIDQFQRYTILYGVTPDAVVVHRLLHSARNPSLRVADPS